MAPQVSDQPRKLQLMPSSAMILYLLFPALLLGTVRSQTEGVMSKGNQALNESTTDSGRMNPGNVTSSVYQDSMSQIEDELESNRTIITEDDENFQKQEFTGLCQEGMLLQYAEQLCGENFMTEMRSVSTENWCILENIIRPYNDLTICIERLSNILGCYYPNRSTQDFFLQIHSQYFHNCSNEDAHFVEEPHSLVVVLTLIPVSLIPALVYIVIWKNHSESHSRPECKSLLSDYQNISNSYLTLTEANSNLRGDNEVLKERSAWLDKQTKVLNSTSAKLMSVNLALSFESSELMKQIVNLTSTNLELTQEHKRLVLHTSKQEEEKLNMSQTIKYLNDSKVWREDEERRLSEINSFLNDELFEVKGKNAELLEVNNRLRGEIKNLNAQITELQEQNQNLSCTVMKERQEAAGTTLPPSTG
ncbi:Receptor activity-modifying protein 3 [Nibea albiflora]|uniref:Receptor activity-modifying protein 3 n=1 Tax=Nibea albiflora TaxID=240163 RepID=A0ACB7F3S3_NIBAL|nr:Receptor activity-modifying protein 3 [Nibea albiflora]